MKNKSKRRKKSPSYKLSFKPGTPEYYHAKQFMYFQVSGQGPYYGQMAWFQKFHHEKVPSAVERYQKEIKRVTGVLDGILAEQKKLHGTANNGPWLVGDHMSYVDIAFVMWQVVADKFTSDEDFNPADYPLAKEWVDKMAAREKIAPILAKAFAAH